MPNQTLDVLEREIWIAARPETIFAFFTDSAKMIQWKGLNATLEPRLHGMYCVNVNGRDVVRGEYLEVIPYHRIVFTWGWEGEDSVLKPGASTVEISLTADGNGTIVRLKHHGLPTREQYQLHAQGWDHYLARLHAVAEGRNPGPDPLATLDKQHG
ncbi:MAG: SRPBCC family protein [Anaerolineales bacterium]